MNYARILVAALFASTLAITPAAADIYLWSQTPATNSNVDLSDDINLVEGMAPSEVNDSARAMMAEVRKWVDDMGASRPSNALITSGGTANAQTLTTNGAGGVVHGQTLCFIVGAGLTNTSSVTLNVDATGTKAVQGLDGTALAGGELAAGSLQCVSYQGTDTVWVLHQYRPIDATTITYTSAGLLQRAALTGDISATAGSNATALGTGVVDSDDIEANTIVADDIATSGVATAEILNETILSEDIFNGTIATADIANLAVTGAKGGMPVGMVFSFAGSACPTGSVAGYGQELDDTTYAALLAVIGTTYGAGGASTFLAPDLRGRVEIGEDDAGGVSANRITTTLNGDTLGATGGEELHTPTEAEMRAHIHSADGTLAVASHTHGAGSFAVATDLTNATSVIRSTDLGSIDNAGTGSYAFDSSPSASTLSLTNGAVTGTSAATAPDVTGNVSSTGSSTAFNVLQPSIVLLKCIYTGV